MIAIHQQEFTDLRLSVAGVVFLGTPFQGSDIAGVGTRLAQISGLDSTILKMLEKDSPDLYGLSRDFWGSHGNWDLVCFYERSQAEYGPIRKQVRSHAILYSLLIDSLHRWSVRNQLAYLESG